MSTSQARSGDNEVRPWLAVAVGIASAAVAVWVARAAAAGSPNLALVLLGVGLLIGALLGGLIYVGQVAIARARALERSNRALAEDLDARIGAEQGLRELNEELEERVAERTADLERAVEELESLNYTVSHDLKSPLGAILNFASILEEDYADVLDDTGRDFLARISSSAHGALAMMEGLLDFSRIGRDPLELEPIAVEALVRDVFDDECARRAGAGLNGRPELVLSELPQAYGDVRLLRRLFEQLLSNAIKFSSKCADARVAVSGDAKNGEGHYVVRDNGVGFDMRHANKLFGVFERLHTQDEFEGGGLGLAMVARIAQRHGGRVWAEATPGEGASFHVALPGAREGRR